MREPRPAVRPSLPIWARISLSVVLLFACAAVWLIFLIHQPPSGQTRRTAMIEKLNAIELGLKDLEQASASVSPVSLIGQDQAMKQWASVYLNYRREVNALSDDSQLPDYQEIQDHMRNAYALENRSEQIRKDIIRNGYTGEQAKGQEAEFRGNLAMAIAEVKAAEQKLRTPSDRAFAFPKTAATIFAMVSFLVACGLVPWLLVTSRRDGEGRRLQQSLNLAQRSLQECETRFQTVFHSTSGGMVLMDDKGYIQQFSPAAERILGVSSVDVTGQSIFKLLPGSDRAKLEEQFRRLTPTRDSGAIEVNFPKADGTEQELELTLRKSADGRMLIALLNARSHVSGGEEGLRRDVGFLAAILDAARVYLVILDRQGRILRCNRASEVLAGRPSPELRGRHFAEVFAPRHADAVRAGLEKIEEGQVPDKLEEFGPGGNGARIVSWTHSLLRNADGKPEYVVVTGADITDIHSQAGARPERSDVSRITGELAFSLGNLLTNISGYAELVLSTMPAGDPSYVDVQQIKESGDRAVILVRKLLAFAGRYRSRPRMIDLNAAAADAARQLAGRLGDRIHLHLELAPEAPQALADGAQLAEILGVLFDNARDAMPGGGHVALRTGSIEGEAAMAQLATISVSDSGHGLNHEDARRIFEPFFTTKEPGKGAGLSLAAVRGMLQQTGGSVRAQGEPGKGTTVEILLPLAGSARGPVLVEKQGTRR